MRAGTYSESIASRLSPWTGAIPWNNNRKSWSREVNPRTIRVMVLRAGYLVVAQRIQEAATAMCHEDIRTRLADTLNDLFRGTGNWAYVVAVFGDDKAGDVVYSCNSDLKKAAYTIAGTGGAKIDTATAVDVQPLTTYEVENAAVEVGEAGARNSKRDLMQLQTIHDASAALGANCSVKEASASAPTSGGGDALSLVESAATVEAIVLREARADYEIKLIAPGKGSSAFYPAEVLRRDGPNVFGVGTHVYVNHPTVAEEAARPEGDVRNLAGVLTSAAQYHESHAKGPGLYARMKVFADHGAMVEEKAPHVGMSIRAAGIAESGRKQDGLPVLKELTRAESVDVVTKAGAGGMILTESAKPAEIQTQEAAGMTEAEAKKLIEAAVSAATAPLRERAIKGDAREEATRLLETVTLPQAAKIRIVERSIANLPVTADGALDSAKLREMVVAEAKAEGEYITSITGGVGVRGMGVAPPAPPKPEDIAAREARAKQELAEDVALYEALGMDRKAAEFAAQGRAA